MSKSSSGPFNAPGHPPSPPPALLIPLSRPPPTPFFYLSADTRWKKYSMLSRTANWLLTLVTRIFLSLSPSSALSFSHPLGPTGPPTTIPVSPPVAFVVEHCVHIYIPARSQLCFCVQINLRRVKNGQSVCEREKDREKGSFRVDSNCFAVFQTAVIEPDKRSDWLFNLFLRHRLT